MQVNGLHFNQTCRSARNCFAYWCKWKFSNQAPFIYAPLIELQIKSGMSREGFQIIGPITFLRVSVSNITYKSLVQLDIGII